MSKTSKYTYSFLFSDIVTFEDIKTTGVNCGKGEKYALFVCSVGGGGGGGGGSI